MAQNKSNPPVDKDLARVDNLAQGAPGYTKQGGPRGGPGVPDVDPDQELPYVMRPVLASPSVSSDRAGAALNIQTVAAGDRARTLSLRFNLGCLPLSRLPILSGVSP